MFRLSLAAIAPIAALSILAAAAFAQLSGPVLEPADGVLTLRNGNVLCGKITPVGDRYLVAVGAGGEVLIPATEVEFHCRDLAEAYQRKLRTINAGDLSHRLRLAQWCLRHELTTEAADQLLAASRIDADHPRFRQLQQRLILATTPPPAAKAPPPAAQSPPPTSPPLPPRKDFDEAVDALPAGAMLGFTSQVQPLLLNRCANAGCHGSRDKSKLQLSQAPRNLPPSQRLTHRNLLSVLETIDRASPADSPLLLEARRAHGGADAPPLSEHDEPLYRQLAVWVAQAAADPAAARPPVRSDAPLAVRAPPALARFPFDTTPAGAPPFAAQTPRAGKSPDGSGPPPGTSPDAFTPVDPFDPEVFNRRFFDD